MDFFMDTTYALDPASDLGGTLFAPPQWAAELGGCEQAEASDDFMSSLSNEVFGVKQESAFLDAEFEVGSGIPDYPSRPLFLDEDELSLASTSSNVSIDELIAMGQSAKRKDVDMEESSRPTKEIKVKVEPGNIKVKVEQGTCVPHSPRKSHRVSTARPQPEFKQEFKQEVSSRGRPRPVPDFADVLSGASQNAGYSGAGAAARSKVAPKAKTTQPNLAFGSTTTVRQPKQQVSCEQNGCGLTGKKCAENGSEMVLLSTCKFTSKRYGQACTSVPVWTRHKRGHHACSCQHGHQWVWCQYCCDCAGAVQGCTEREHWFERDAFDTGRRNHMNRHAKPLSPDHTI
mmetsp:Transcript_40626/g.95464  ORF Transcript_40626/g.95464 Transcript_40626/m.95464 type:complete len:344 (-) Transcript_40626:319-1350(-)